MTLGFLNVCIYVQAICDARQRFVFVYMDILGATRDSRAFSFSALWAALQIISGYYILGDATYRGTSHTVRDDDVTPYVDTATRDNKREVATSWLAAVATAAMVVTCPYDTWADFCASASVVACGKRS